MKRLSEFEGEQGVIIVAKLMKPLYNVVAKIKDIKEPEKMSPIELITTMLENSPKDVKEIFAILSETPVDEYECNAATIMVDTLKLASDEQFMSLFGSQSQTQTSFGSASETTEAR